MTLYLPYTFVGGTAAKAQEVNANFQQTKNYIEDLETTYANYGSLISNLQSGKADVNGSSSQVFRVAYPTGGTDAVNRGYLFRFAEWLQYVISGMHITIVDDDTISVGLGGCFDTTGNYIIENKNPYTTGSYGSSLSANATYSVWVKAPTDNIITSVTGLYLVGQNDSPGILPNEVIKRIGYVTTDGNAHFTSARKEDY